MLMGISVYHHPLDKACTHQVRTSGLRLLYVESNALRSGPGTFDPLATTPKTSLSDYLAYYPSYK